MIYADLVTAVYERSYEKHRAYVPIRHMKLDEFFRVLEEIGLAAWHGDGRTTTVREIEKQCRISGLGALLDAFQEGAMTGVTRLLAAFFSANMASTQVEIRRSSSLTRALANTSRREESFGPSKESRVNWRAVTKILMKDGMTGMRLNTGYKSLVKVR